MARYRVTGLSPWGVAWERKDDDREIARRVVSLLGDRRMLWKDFRYEIEEHCITSANLVRQEIGKLVASPEISAALGAQLQAMQRLFRAFVDDVGTEYDHRGSGERSSHFGTDPLSMALGRLRALVGVQVGRLAVDYDLEIGDELATIVPDEAGWLFERFDT